MGMLDKRDESEFALPNFDSSFAPTRRPHSPEDDTTTEKSNQHEETGARRVDSDTTSMTGKQSQSSITNSPSKLAASSSTTQATATQRAPHSKPRRATLATPKATTRDRRRSSAKVFDLYHEDRALQDAVPRIHFCDVCFCACDIH